MDKKIVLCVGDSLGMPREELSFKYTWHYLLSVAYPNYLFVNNFHRALTTQQLRKTDLLENYNPDIIVLQVGIVDCAPRYFKKTSLWPKIVNRLPKSLKKKFWSYFKRFNKRENKYAFVLPNEFRRHLINYFERCQAINVDNLIVLLIQKPGSQMISKNSSILQNIETYNSIIIDVAKKFNFVKTINPLSNAMDSDYIFDGYHLSDKGAKKVFENLKEHF